MTHEEQDEPTSTPPAEEVPARAPAGEGVDTSDDVTHGPDLDVTHPELLPPRPKGRKQRKAEARARQDEPITFWQGVKEVVIILLLAAVVAIMVQSFFFRAFIIPSSSMEPTLKVGDRVLVDRVTYYFRKPQLGDIVVWRYPPDSPKSVNTTNRLYWPFQQIGETLHITHRGTQPFVKRVIATGGQTLKIRNGQVYIDGKPIKEPYIVADSSNFGPVTVPRGMFYGLGDNRPNSRDSRFFGPIPYRAIIGKVILIWWPPSQFGIPKG
jgi:signal peptidase I